MRHSEGPSCFRAKITNPIHFVQAGLLGFHWWLSHSLTAVEFVYACLVTCVLSHTSHCCFLCHAQPYRLQIFCLCITVCLAAGFLLEIVSNHFCRHRALLMSTDAGLKGVFLQLCMTCVQIFCHFWHRQHEILQHDMHDFRMPCVKISFTPTCSVSHAAHVPLSDHA